MAGFVKRVGTPMDPGQIGTEIAALKERTATLRGFL
jgi:hypothetical protein